MSEALPWLELDGVEIMNSLRALTYAREGRGCFRPDQIGTRSPLLPESGYTDIYLDAGYTADFFDAQNLLCYCKAFDGGPYQNPQNDKAPWFNVNRSESAEFLGFIVDSIDVGPVLSRVVTPRIHGGTVGRIRKHERIIKVSAIMLADSNNGMSWGQNWLAEQLSEAVEDDGAASMRLYLKCPPVGADPNLFIRTLIQTGVFDGPNYTAISPTMSRACVQRVEMQFVSSSPYLLSQTITKLPVQQLKPNSSLTALVSADQGVPASAVVTVQAGSIGTSVSGVTIKATPTTNNACPTADTAQTGTYTISRLERGTTLVIDAASKAAYVQNITTTTSPVGLDALSFSGLFNWFDIPTGQQLCVTVTAPAGAVINPGTAVTIGVRHKELA